MIRVNGSYLWIVILLVFLAGFFLLGGVFLVLVVRLWFIWVPLLLIGILWSWLSRLRAGRDAQGTQEPQEDGSFRSDSGPGRVIETEYRVEKDDESGKK